MFTVAIKIPPTATTVRNGEAHLAAWSLSPGVLISVAEGQLTMAMGDALVTACRDALERFGKLELFFAWAEVSGYAPKVRADLANLVRDTPQILGIRVLSKAPIVSMGLTALRLSTAIQVECFSEEMPFLAAFRRARSITGSGFH